MVTRTLTPEDWLISFEPRASKVRWATISFMKSGTRTAVASRSETGTSCSMLAISSSSERIALGCRAPPALAADGRDRVVVDRAAGDHRNERIEERGQAPDDAALRLPALAQEDHVVPGEDRVLDLGDDGVIVADDAREDALAPAEAGEEVLPHLLADREHPVPRSPELPQRSRRSNLRHERVPRSREVRGLYAPPHARHNPRPHPSQAKAGLRRS